MPLLRRKRKSVSQDEPAVPALDLAERRIRNLAGPLYDTDAANKKYVDDEIQKALKGIPGAASAADPDPSPLLLSEAPAPRGSSVGKNPDGLVGVAETLDNAFLGAVKAMSRSPSKAQIALLDAHEEEQAAAEAAAAEEAAAEEAAAEAAAAEEAAAEEAAAEKAAAEAAAAEKAAEQAAAVATAMASAMAAANAGDSNDGDADESAAVVVKVSRSKGKWSVGTLADSAEA